MSRSSRPANSAISGGYSTADGIVGEISIGERNLLGRGQMARAAVTLGQRTRGFEVSFIEPYFLDYRLAWGLDLYAKEVDASQFYTYKTTVIGGGTRLGFALREDMGMQLRYSIYRQELTLDGVLQDCTPATIPAVLPVPPNLTNCYSNGEASLAVRQQAAAGPVFTSLIGYSITYNTLDNNRNPTKGFSIEVRQDFAGIGGDVNFIRTSGDARFYYEIMSDIVGVLRLQGGHVAGWGGKEFRMLDHFFMGPNLVRGFAPAGIGPRDLTPGTTQDALGGTMYWGASVEVQIPIIPLPKDFGMKLALFADAGSLWGYKGPTFFPATGETLSLVDPTSLRSSDSHAIRSSVGAGIVWESPFGPIRIDYAWALTKEGYDRVQELRFSGGTKF